MRRLLAPCLAAAAVLSPIGSAAAAGQVSSGTYRLGANATGTPIELFIGAGGRSVTVSLGAGHAVHQVVALSRRGGHLRFALPGAPVPLLFEGGLSRGTVRQGGAHGTYTLRPGVPAKGGIEPALLGPYRTSAGRGLAVVGFWGPTQLIDLDSGAIRLLSRRTRLVWAAGSSFGGGADGSVTFGADGDGFRWTHADGSVEQATR